MDLKLKEKVALVTGAGQGVGREVAKYLASEGVKVVVNDLFMERASLITNEIKDMGGKAMGVQGDVTNLDQVKNMIAKVSEVFGSIDILVNNAGVHTDLRAGKMSFRKVFAESDYETWKKHIDLNLYGCLNCTHSVLKSMIDKKEGKIISIISEAGRVGEEYMAVYSGAKAGILGFTKALAKEVGRYCINANCIAIGATAHEGTKPVLNPDATPETDPVLQKWLKFYPIGKGLGRVGRPFDVAFATAFLASPNACFITGQCLSVSGGFSMVC